MSEKLLLIKNVNVIAVDWGGGSASMYSQSAANTRLVALEISFLLRHLMVSPLQEGQWPDTLIINLKTLKLLYTGWAWVKSRGFLHHRSFLGVTHCWLRRRTCGKADRKENWKDHRDGKVQPSWKTRQKCSYIFSSFSKRLKFIR